MDSTNPTSAPGASESFLKSSWTWESTNPYGDFFQETSDGNISIGTKSQKSWLEIATGILSYVVPIVIVATLLSSLHVYLRTQESSSFAENYQFLCPYMNMWVDTPDDKWCKTLTMIQKDYTEKTDNLKTSMIELLTEYIPIKTSRNIMDASPERKFIFDIYENKIHVDDIMRDFETVKKSSSYAGFSNIVCNGISITNGDSLSTQCTIYWWKIGDDDSNKKLGSARIEALRFLDNLGNTPKSNFILLNPPTSLSTDEVMPDENGEVNSAFSTQTIVQIQARYVPFNQKS